VRDDQELSELKEKLHLLFMKKYKTRQDVLSGGIALSREQPVVLTQDAEPLLGSA
jgi:hypothetical protein